MSHRLYIHQRNGSANTMPSPRPSFKDRSSQHQNRTGRVKRKECTRFVCFGIVLFPRAHESTIKPNDISSGPGNGKRDVLKNA